LTVSMSVGICLSHSVTTMVWTEDVGGRVYELVSCCVTCGRAKDRTKSESYCGTVMIPIADDCM
jgi:hypothetical protein